MERHGFIHDMLDLKVLLLFMMARLQYPVNVQKAYELALQDDCVSYFDVAEALPQMVETGHLKCENGYYSITEKGIETGKLTDDSLAFPVMQRVKAAVDYYNIECRRDKYIQVQTLEKSEDEYSTKVILDDEMGTLMTLELSAPSRKQAIVLSRELRGKAERIYQMIISELLYNDEKENID